MNILFIVPYVPNLIRVRPYHLIRHLAARGHEVTVLTLWSNQQERADAEALKEHCHRVIALPLPRWRSLWSCLRALPTRVPLQAVYCWSPGLQSPISNLQSQVDVVHVEHLRGARYGLHVGQKPVFLEKTGFSKAPVVWDSVDCISYLFEQAAHNSRSPFGRLMTRLELNRTRHYEAWLVGQFDRVLVTSEVDRQALQHLASRFTFHVSRSAQPATCNLKPETITVLPNGVDLTYFTPSNEPRDPATLVITGKMSYHANVTAVLHLVNDIMPHVWAHRPDVQVWIVGKDPAREITKLKSQISNIQYPISNPSQPPSAIHHQPSAISHQPIAVTGTVPDIRPYLRRATLAVAPVPYGAGIQNKVLEAMACGTPVVATPQAVSALQAVSGQHLVVAEGAAAFAEAVLRLLDDPARRRHIGEEARRYVEHHHDWNRIAEQLEAIYQEVIVAHRSHPTSTP